MSTYPQPLRKTLFSELKLNRPAVIKAHGVWCVFVVPNLHARKVYREDFKTFAEAIKYATEGEV